MPATTETLTMERDFDASPERVFEAWTRVEVLRSWFGCATDMVWNIRVWDVREGGRIHVSLDCDGEPYEVFGEFLVVQPPQKLVYRWAEEDVVDVTIEPRGSRTRLRLEHTFPADKEGREMRSDGWSSAFDMLGRI